MPARRGTRRLFEHPAFQSLVLPLLLAFFGMAALRNVHGGGCALWGAALGLLGALAVLPGFQWPVEARQLKLPWVVLAGLAATLLAHGCRRSLPGPGWVSSAALAGWAAAGLWLANGQASLPLLGAAAVIGWATLAQGVRYGGDAAPSDPLVLAVVLFMAALGLAVLMAGGGSFLLAQLALMLATAVGAAGAWAWWRPSSRTAAAAGVFLAVRLTWLSMAWCWVLGAPAPVEPHAMRVAVLVLAFAAPALASRLCNVATALHRRLLCVMLLAALPVAVALAWPGNAGLVRMPDTPQHQDDPYRTPSWR